MFTDQILISEALSCWAIDESASIPARQRTPATILADFALFFGPVWGTDEMKMELEAWLPGVVMRGLRGKFEDKNQL
jgi:hypothetical protein